MTLFVKAVVVADFEAETNVKAVRRMRNLPLKSNFSLDYSGRFLGLLSALALVTASKSATLAALLIKVTRGQGKDRFQM